MQLIDRIEAAAGGSRELDAEIWRLAKPNAYAQWEGSTRAMLNRDWDEARRQVTLRARAEAEAPKYTTSLDAAMSLVPDGAGFQIDRYWIAGPDGPVWSAHIQTGGIPSNPRQVFEAWDRPTPALAICAAALKARAT